MTVQDVDNAFRKKADASVKLFGLRKKIENGTATMEDAAQYQMMLSKILGQTVGENILKIPESERVKFLDWILRNQYQETNDRLAVIQQFLDKQLGINIAPQKAPFPEERVNQLGRSLTDPTVPESTIQRRARAGTETVTKSFHDAYVKKNASFRSRAGLKCYITRKAVSGCCEWCTAMAGRYVCGEEPDDIYRRHDNCDCTVTFENGRKRQDVWSKRTWEAPKEGAGAGAPVDFIGKEVPQKDLTILPNNDTIKSEKRIRSFSQELTEKYGFKISEAFEQLDEKLCRDSFTGFEYILAEFPELLNTVQKIKVIRTHKVPMSCERGTLNFNSDYFSSYDILSATCKRQSEIRHWIQNSSPASVMVHECTHAIESLLINLSPDYLFDFQREDAWRECSEASKIVSKAIEELHQNGIGLDQSKVQLVSAISKQSLISDSETLAEAFADVYANGTSANPLSIIIRRITFDTYSSYKKGRV